MGYYTRFTLKIIGSEEIPAVPAEEESYEQIVNRMLGVPHDDNDKVFHHSNDKTSYHEIIIAHLRKTNPKAEYAMNENGEEINELKWYDHEDDLTKFSKLYPDHIFELSGEGESDATAGSQNEK